MTTVDQPIETPKAPRISDDWLAVFCAAVLLLVSFTSVWIASDFGGSTAEASVKATNPLKPWIAKPAKWTSSPFDSFVVGDDAGVSSYGPIPGVLQTTLWLSPIAALYNWFFVSLAWPNAGDSLFADSRRRNDSLPAGPANGITY